VPRSKRPTNAQVEESSELQPTGRPSVGDRIAAFAMLDGMGDASQALRCLRLSLIGFSNAEIAQMLQTTPAVVASNLYAERKKSRPAKRKSK
jgi:hypothetical protein